MNVWISSGTTASRRILPVSSTKLLFSKPLADEPLAIWNGRNIHLTEQIGKESKYHGQDRIWLMQFRISYTFCFTDAKITKWEATFPHSFDYLNV